MEQTEYPETPAHKIRAPENLPQERIQHSEYGKNVKSRNFIGYKICKIIPRAVYE
jgi:hypothetical protein